MSIFLREHYGNSRLTALQIVKDPVLLLAFGFGSGLSKKMPGTLGTLAAVPLYLALRQTSDLIYLLVTLVSVGVGIVICDQAAKKLDVHDFGGIVWDEIAGLLITMIGITFSWQSLLAGFVLFRLFDIVKPWPIRWLDRNVAGGFGIMIDDVLAGVFAALVLHFWF
ncbi:MAG: phosphatidylglycerophosphatase A family protein [Methylomonas sp.]